ncbi:coenzyme F420-reducing hydrogenase, beta subunit [Longilinea arvoryzae]|uniref:Coenzyme F420-reducing hydrogenase, beta subunit n=1 Tax=Longilinea arvoryzae TaxID=360412 RepID=A0A0S7BE52_9CHLR|nr:Coenzyme F420 hydrogenase/dehydrogenase, beta subunit C-terminal domain [Longilinea arvoryzae]GAP13705.1 coenzyme F420-reducing hydrogenase, beta subunit [Longilinea arvoryzae]
MVKRLETEVWDLDNCSGCGMCVAACSKQVLAWGEETHPVRQMRTKNLGLSKTTLDSCTFCRKFCEEVCPRLEHWLPIEAQSIQSAHARGPVFSGAPNDIARAVISAGRSAGLLDGMIMLDLDRWNLEPVARIGSTVEQIVDTIGPQYLWAPIFDALNEAVFEQKMENIAVIGTPCSAQAIRKLRSSTNELLKPYQKAIRLSVAVFCTGIYRPEMIDEVLVKRMNVSRDQVRRLEISPDRQWLQATLWDGSVRTIQRQQAESFTRPGCGKCDDYLGESADLAIGTLGAPAGTSTLIVRSQAGAVFTRNAVQMGLLETSPEVDVQALEAAASEKDRRERAQAFKDLEILMLDGLVDPKKRADAIQQFIRLYRTPVRPGAVEAFPRGCTGC